MTGPSKRDISHCFSVTDMLTRAVKNWAPYSFDEPFKPIEWGTKISPEEAERIMSERASVGGLAGSQRFTNVAEFGLLLAPPLLLFVACSAALPRFDAGEAFDMRSAYQNERRVLFLALALYQLSIWATIILTRGFVWDNVAVLRTTILVLILSALFTKSRRWDWVVVTFVLASIVYRIAIQPVR